MLDVEVPPARIPKLPKNLIKEIFMYIPSAKIFKDRLYALNKLIYNDQNFIDHLFSQLLMQKLGIITDYSMELDYIKKVLKMEELPEVKRNY